MRKINPHAKMAIIMGLFLGIVIFLTIYFITEGDRVIFASVFGLAPLIVLLSLVGEFFDPGPPE